MKMRVSIMLGGLFLLSFFTKADAQYDADQAFNECFPVVIPNIVNSCSDQRRAEALFEALAWEVSPPEKNGYGRGLGRTCGRLIHRRCTHIATSRSFTIRFMTR